VIRKKNGTVRGPVDWDRIRARIGRAGETRTLSREAKDAILAERARTMARASGAIAENAIDLRLATFMLAHEHYGIEARLVVEIGRLSDFTPLPSAPPELVGITNLRGQILPIFDLRALLGLSRRALDDLSRLVVLGDAQAEFGILADSTRELVTIAASELLSPPSSVSESARRYMRGVTKDALVVLDAAVLLEDPRLFCNNRGDDQRL
jgi:purine-binding chemotaxis protein CheW